MSVSKLTMKKPTKKQQRAKLHREWRKHYEDFVRIQGEERCAIKSCGKLVGIGERKLHIDSNHKTDRPRGLLCSRCNRRLRWWLEDPEWLRAAADYLDDPPLKNAEGRIISGP